MKEVVKITDKLKTELPKILKEHKAIVVALDKSVKVAKEEGEPEIIMLFKTKLAMMFLLASFVLIFTNTASALINQNKNYIHIGDNNMKAKIPESLKLEHEELHEQLTKATEVGGKTGEAAKLVAKTLHPHFVAEEEFAIPPLGILPQLAAGKLDNDMKEVIKMTNKLKAELPKMLEEHKAIVIALDKLVNAAKEEDKPEYAEFAEKLKLHAKTEEEVTYPTALLIGEYLKLKLD